MNKKWFLAIFVFAFTFSFSAFGFADTIGNNGTCSDSAADGYEICYASLHVGDGVSGGRDDYDFHWNTTWGATDSNSANFSQGNYYASGVDSSNDDYISNVTFSGSTSATFYNCVPRKLRSMTSTTACFDYYNKSLNEGGPYPDKIHAEVDIYDPENVGYYHLSVNFAPTS
jgi:hypothetical protein